MGDAIELRELRLGAFVGVSTEERSSAQPVAIDLEIERPFEAAAFSDDLAETTNYADVLALASRVATQNSFLLLETLAYRVAGEVLDFDEAISAVTVAVRKLHPPVPEDVAAVGVRCTLRRG